MKIRSSQDILNMCRAMCTTQQTTNSVDKRANAPKPIVKKADTKPEIKVISPKPIVKKADTKPEIKVSSPKPIVKKADTKPEIKVGSPKVESSKKDKQTAGKTDSSSVPASQPIVAIPIESPKAGKGLKFNIANFVKPQPTAIATTEQTGMRVPSPETQVNAIKQTAERKVFNPRPGKSLEDKVKELKTHISFGPSEGKAISEDQLNAMINFFIDGKGFKKQMKKMGCKANLNTIHMTEVPHDKYEGIDDKFDMVFEVPTNKASNPIIIMYCSTPEWNEQINSFVSSREIKMASEMKLSKKKDKKSEVSDSKPEASSSVA